MIEALNGKRIREGLEGDPIALLKQNPITGYLLISSMEGPEDAAILAIKGTPVGAEYLSDNEAFLGISAFRKIRSMRNCWIDLFEWDETSIMKVMERYPKAGIKILRQDAKRDLEGKEEDKRGDVKSVQKTEEKGKGLSALLPQVKQQVESLEDQSIKTGAPPEMPIPADEAIGHQSSIESSLQKPRGADELAGLRASMTLEEALREGLEELKRLSSQLDKLIEETNE